MNVLAVSLVLLSRLASPPTVSTGAAVTAVEAEFAAAWAAHDAKAMASLWAENGDFMNPMGGLARGRKELEALFAGEHAGVVRKSTYGFRLDSSRTIAPGVVLTDWTNTIEGMVTPDGKALPPFVHHVMTVFVKRDGRWWKTAARAFAILPPPPEQGQR